MGCAYVFGYWDVSEESVIDAFTIQRLFSLPWKVWTGFGAVATAYAGLTLWLVAYAKGLQIKPVAMVAAALALFIAMHLAIYERFELMELYPFAGFFVVSLLIFRFETKIVAAVLFAVIVIVFYALCAKELGERDAKEIIESGHMLTGFSKTILT